MGNESEKPALNPEIVPPGMENTPAFKKTGKRSEKIRRRDALIAQMVAAGFSAGKAAKILGLADTTGYRAMQRIEGEDKGISGLVSTERDARFLSLIDDYMERGKKIKKIRGSDALGAAKLYGDRRFPILRQDAPPPPMVFAKVDVSVIRIERPRDKAAETKDNPG